MRWTFWKEKQPRKALRVRLQHEQLDAGAIEGLWVGDYDGYLHLRAVKVLIQGQDEVYRHSEILVPTGKVIYLEVLGSDANPDPSLNEVGDPA